MSIDGFLMRKNIPLVFIIFKENGEIEKSNLLSENLRKYLPVPCQGKQSNVKEWWKKRAVPIGQGGVREFLIANGYSNTDQYLLKNLGLSLTDCYWFKPTNLADVLTWENVNLYENYFDENKFIEQNNNRRKKAKYSPNGSLQGQIEKTWIIKNDERYLLKGNSSACSTEAINEVIASELHRLQGYDNYTPYKLTKIEGKLYDYGCLCKLFTSNTVEFVSAHDILSLTKRRNETSFYEHFIANCEILGMDVEKLREDLEYQIMTDFILSQPDRHMNNVGILRDADTLEPIRMAPIYDSGACLFAGKNLPQTMKELTNIQINSFCEREKPLVKAVRDYNIVDLDKLPPRSFIENMYEKDSKFLKDDIHTISSIYQKKIDMYKMLLAGKNPFH